ncbi:MAG TPA: hypothetical protein VH253_10815 [Phycisphaerae bacterium]|nr:hypothetical protein [Phycisphaerae bacterium]
MRYSCLLAAACVAATCFTLAPAMADDYTTNAPAAAQNGAVEPTLPNGVKPKAMSEKNSIQNAFESATESAFNSKGFPDVIDNLVDQDRTRLQHEAAGEPSKPGDPLTQKIGEVKSEWQQKYHQQFDIKNEKVYDNYLTFTTGEIDNPQALIGNWPVAITPNHRGSGGQATAADVNDATHHAFGGDVNLGKGRDVAVAVLPGHGQLPALTTSLIHEAGGWKFDIPNNVTRQQLHDTLLANLSYLSDHKDNWPSDVKAAYRNATCCVVAALYDVNIEHLNNKGQAKNSAPNSGNHNNNRTANER